jgi:signal transduction histidine kinase
MARSKDSNRLMQTDKDMMDLNQALREAMEALGRKRKDIAFRHRLRQNLPRLKFDKDKLKQILLDLFANAADAMPLGGALTVETSLASREEMRKFIPQPASDLYVRVRIRDGATIVVHLPVSAAEVSRFIGAHRAERVESGGSETILIVDDDGTIVETTREILKAWDIES